MEAIKGNIEIWNLETSPVPSYVSYTISGNS